MPDQSAEARSEVSLVLGETFKNKSQAEVLALFDEEVARFSKFMENLTDWRAQGPLSDPEKVLIKTFLVHKYRERF